MKTLKSFILASLLLSAGGSALACGPWYYSASDNDIYRILPYGAEGPAIPVSPDFTGKNLLLWSAQTGFADTAAIREALYDGWSSFHNWEKPLALAREGRLLVSPAEWWSKESVFSNAFVRHLVATRDTDAVRLILWSKKYSNIRNAQRSPWYYNSALETDEDRQMRELYGEVKRYTPEEKYADRYLFLTIKCSWALGDSRATLALWDELGPKMKDSVLHSEARDYIARALFDMGRGEDAKGIYRERGDIASLMQLGGYDLPELLGELLLTAPESRLLAVELQRHLFSLENNPYALTHPTCLSGYEDAERVLPIARRAARTTVRSRRAMWQYTAACLLDYLGRPAEALRELDGIDALPCDGFLKNSIRVMRFYLRAKTEPVDDTLERYALFELKWMDGELQREWDETPESDRYKLRHVAGTNAGDMYRSCYMYDAMRRILLPDSVGLCPRMAAAGRAVRALQLANMAENRFFQVSGNVYMEYTRRCHSSYAFEWNWDMDGHEGFENSWYCWLEPDFSWRGLKRTIESYGNSHDYSNWMFLLADRLDARTLEEYRRRIENPLDDNDRWLNERGYTDSDYWQDIIGTHFLRECDYTSAIEHLEPISPEYQEKMNVWFSSDPFSYAKEIPNRDKTSYKLRFARRMAELEQRMERGGGDSRGLAMLEYSIGMRNSFTLCWYLTTYAKTEYIPEVDSVCEWCYTLDEWQSDPSPVSRLTALTYPYMKKYTALADSLQRKALATVVSDGAKALAYSRLGMYGKVVREFTRTPIAQHYALVCDRWKDYRINRPFPEMADAGKKE